MTQNNGNSVHESGPSYISHPYAGTLGTRDCKMMRPSILVLVIATAIISTAVSVGAGFFLYVQSSNSVRKLAAEVVLMMPPCTHVAYFEA